MQRINKSAFANWGKSLKLSFLEQFNFTQNLEKDYSHWNVTLLSCFDLSKDLWLCEKLSYLPD